MLNASLARLAVSTLALEAQVGNATLTFSDPANGTLQFNVGAFSATKAISSLPF